jgi:hypothetical protein
MSEDFKFKFSTQTQNGGEPTPTKTQPPVGDRWYEKEGRELRERIKRLEYDRERLKLLAEELLSCFHNTEYFDVHVAFMDKIGIQWREGIIKDIMEGKVWGDK